MRFLFLFAILFAPMTQGADIKSPLQIACISGDSSSLGRRIQSIDPDTGDNTETRIADWTMKESFGGKRSKVKFIWTPESDQGPKIKLVTTDRPHNLIKIRSRTESTLIVVSSTSNFYSAESWTFAINFNVETVIANRMLSNGSGVGSEQITYDCEFGS